jgi:AcrR family transcriptional regulator
VRITSDRLSAPDYFRAALDVLGEAGSDGLTIAALCARLKVTKGSFYHHFLGMPDFVDELLTFWEAEHSDRVVAAPRTERDPRRRLDSLAAVAMELPHDSEAALRAWGRSRADVAEAVGRVDKRRERQLTDTIAALGVDRVRARTLARLALNLLIGGQQRDSPVDVRRLRLTMEDYLALVHGELDGAVRSRRGARR